MRDIFQQHCWLDLVLTLLSPRLPFEPISKEEYILLQNKVIERKVNNDFFDALNKYDVGELSEAGPAGCDSDKCLLPLAKPKD